MSDITEQQMDDLIQTLNKSAGSLGKIADKFSSNSQGRANARDTLRQNLNAARKEDTKQTQDHFKAIKDATGAVKNYAMTFTEFAVGATVLRELWKWGKQTSEVYRDLSNYGQSFGGSMIRMTAAAADAGLPLKAFAEAIKHNSVVVKQMGEGPNSFASVQKNLRTMTEKSGLYGYSIEELNDLTLDYMDTQRLAGKNLSKLAGPASAAEIQKFALGVTGIADVLGTERKAVMEQTMKLMQDGEVSATMRLNSLQGMEGYNKAMTEVVADLKAQPGKAGEVLGQAMSETFSNVGGAMFTDLGKKLAETGQGGAMAILDEANQRVKAGEDSHKVAMETVSKMSDELTNPETLNSLRLLASTGNASAKEILAMASSMKKYTLQDVKNAEEARKNSDNFTTFMNSFESVFEKLKGAFISGFLQPFMTMGKIDPEKVKQFWDHIEALGPVLGRFGEQIGGVISQLAKPGTLELIGSVISGMLAVGRIVINTTTFIMKMMTTVFGGIHKALSIFGQKTADVGTGLAAIAAWFAGKALFKAVLGGFARMFGMAKVVTVNGRIVNVNGGGGGGLGADDLIGEGEGKGAKGASAMARREAKLRKLKAKGISKGLKGAALEEFMMKEATGGKLGGLMRGVGKVAGKVPGAAKIGGIAGKLMGLGKGMAPALRTAGKFAGPIAAGLAAVFTVADAANSIKEIHDQVAAGKMTPEQGRKALGKIAGSTTGSLAGGLVGGLVGQALIPIPGVGFAIGSVVGGLVGDKLGGMAGSGIAGMLGGSPKAAGGRASAGAVATPAGSPVVGNPTVIDDDALLQTRTDAMLGNDKAISELKKIQEALDRHTAILASQQAKNIQATQATTSAIRAGQGV